MLKVSLIRQGLLLGLLLYLRLLRQHEATQHHIRLRGLHRCIYTRSKARPPPIGEEAGWEEVGGW